MPLGPCGNSVSVSMPQALASGHFNDDAPTRCAGEVINDHALSRYRQAAHRAVDWFAARIDNDRSVGDECGDLYCVYKLPYLMQLAGHLELAHCLLDGIHVRFLRPDSNFMTTDDVKTADPVLACYPGYINGWIAMAAHKVGRFDLSSPAWGYLRGFRHVGQEVLPSTMPPAGLTGPSKC